MNQNETFWTSDPQELLRMLETRTEGLHSGEAEARIAQNGLNSLKQHRRNSPVFLFLNQFKSPITIILLLATGVSLYLHDFTDSIIIFTIIFLSAVLSFFQEYRAGTAVEELLRVVCVTSPVRRDGKEEELPIEQLTVGDIVIFSSGDIIPADCALISSNELTVDESTLTGETFPVEKKIGPLPQDTALAKRNNSLWMGTHVVSGSGEAVIVHTAKDSEFGKISAHLNTKEVQTEFEHGVMKFGYMLMEITLFMILIIFLSNILQQKPVFDSFLFAMALAVGLTPQLLPAIISVNLSRGAKNMAKKNVIVKKLSSIENFGSMNILCSDKTGTITKGSVELDYVTDGNGNENDTVFLAAYLNAALQAGYANPIDDAIRAKKTVDISGYQKLREIPYSFLTKRLSIIATAPEGSPLTASVLMITKGALQNVLDSCLSVYQPDGSTKPLENERERIMDLFRTYSAQGYRVLGLSFKSVDVEQAMTVEEEDMTFLGFLLFLDPVKENLAQTVAEMKRIGVELKIITGDNRLIGSNIAKQVGLDFEQILTGDEMQTLNDSALQIKAAQTSVFAEIDPNQKERIILALKKAGNVVGYMGDGINDAPALHSADVGISVNTATDTAKNTASIVLLEQDLAVLLEGIKEGRKTFANTLKYVFMATSANFGNMFSMAGASLFLPFLPLLPKQILATNLLTDLPEMQIAGDSVDDEMMDRPRRWNIRFIQRFMIVFGLLSSVFDYLTFAVLLLFFRAGEPMFQAGWFTESILSASMVVLVIRTRKPFYRSKPGKGLLIATVLTAILVLSFPYTPVAPLLQIYPMPPVLLLALGALIVLYVLCAEIAKHFFYKHWNDDL